MNIANLLRRTAADHAGQVALRMDDEEIGYGHLAETAVRFARTRWASRSNRSSVPGSSRPPPVRTPTSTRSASSGCRATPSRPGTGTSTSPRSGRTAGTVRTGPSSPRDADGYLYYVDRIDDMIVSGGENIFPQMVEEVAVIGTAHERWVEQVTAVVVPNREGVTADDIAAYCATNPNLRGMHRPRRIEIVDALPRTGSGKLNRPELRKLFP